MYRVWYWAMIDRDGEPTRASGCGRRPTRSPTATELRNAEPDPIQGGRPCHYPGGSRAPGSVANSALSHVGLNADHGQAFPRKAQSRLGSGRKAYAHDSSSPEEGGREEDQAGEELDVAPGRLARAIAG